MSYLAYNLLLACLAPVVVPFYLLRARRKGQAWKSLPQRLGILPPPLDQTYAESIWLHAVSVGEVISCVGLVQGLRQRYPDRPIFLSTTTATGQRLAAERLSAWVNGIFYAPLDLPFAVRRVLRRLRPALVIVAETEIWPNLFREVKRFGAGLLVVNGRVSDQSLPRYQRFRFFFSDVLRYPDVILAQSALDRDRIISIGGPAGNIHVNGNLKYDFEASQASLPAELSKLFARLRPEPLIVAGSTRENEEAPVVEAFAELARDYPRALLVIAPRHPQRFEQVQKLLARQSLHWVRRSQLSIGGAPEVSLPAVLLLDSLGELSALYQATDLVFVGGSLNGWGGHNVLEPALAGKPVIVGPYMQNFRAITDELLAEAGMVQIQRAEQLAPAWRNLIEHPDQAAALGWRARQVAESQRGATERALRAADGLLDRAVPRMPALGWEYLLLGLPALAWGLAMRVRTAAYHRGWRRRRRLQTFTVCVGNLTTGGVGKTPLVLWLVKRLHARGHRMAVLSRGYHRISGEAKTVLQPGSAQLAPYSGDEAQILLRHFAQLGADVPIGVSANRFAAGSDIERERALDLMVLDDGFQHLALERDLDLVLVDATQPFDNGHLLPLGRLRESPQALRRADAILLTRTQPQHRYDGIERELRALQPYAPIFRSRTRTVGAVEAATGSGAPLDELRSKRALAFCGLGNPRSFWQSLRDHRFTLVERMRYRDHHRYSAHDVLNVILAAKQRQAEILLTTEKDLMNLWHALPYGPNQSAALDGAVAALFEPLPLYWLRIECEIDDEERFLGWVEGRLVAARSQPQRPTAMAGPAR